MNPHQVVKPLDLSRMPSADEFNRMPEAERQQWIEALRHALPSAPTITKAARPRIPADRLVKIQQLRSRGFAVDQLIHDLRSQGADDARVIDIVEGCANGAW